MSKRSTRPKKVNKAANAAERGLVIDILRAAADRAQMGYAGHPTVDAWASFGGQLGHQGPIKRGANVLILAVMARKKMAAMLLPGTSIELVLLNAAACVEDGDWSI